MRALLFITIIQFSIYCHGQYTCDIEYGGRTGKLKITEDMKVIPYKASTNLWGLKKKSNDSILIQAQFKKICENFNDTVFIVEAINNDQGAINSKGKIVAPFLKGLYQFNVSDTSINYGGVLFAPICINNIYFTESLFFVNSCGDCITYDYYPCPNGVKIANINNLSDAQANLQKAFDYKFIDPSKAAGYIIRAIELDTLKSSSYYSCVKMFMDKNELYIISQKKSYYERFYPLIEYCIQKGLKIEHNPHYLLKLNKYKRVFYKSCIDNKIMTKEAGIEIKRLKKLMQNEEYSFWW
jgi:hypothetical protein